MPPWSFAFIRQPTTAGPQAARKQMPVWLSGRTVTLGRLFGCVKERGAELWDSSGVDHSIFVLDKYM